MSDGLTVLVNDIQSIRDHDIDRSLPVGLPPGVTPPGAAPLQPAAGEEPPRVSLALYLHASCHAQNGTVYSIDGSLTFASLFSGDPNETDGADRLTEAEFEARFADPRDMQADCNIDPDLMPYIAEQSSSLKLGLHLPGTHIPIVDEQRLFDEQPDYAVMLSWHYATPIIRKLRERGLKSKIVIPLPRVHVIED